MCKVQVFKLSATFIASAIASTSIAQPPPPPPPGMPDYVAILEDAFNAQNLSAYREWFHEDVQVFKDGRLIAGDRPSYLKLVQADFDRNLHLSHLSWAQGSQIFVMERVQGCIPHSPDSHTVYHGCYWARAVRYDLADDDKIKAVHILEADSAWNIHPVDK